MSWPSASLLSKWNRAYKEENTMKKLIAILLAVITVLGLVACGNINDTEVSILWADEGIVKIPNSLINSMERAMYTEGIAYSHYGANGDQTAQTKQAEEVLNNGCCVLLVNLVDASAAQTIVDLAKAKNVPVIFFDCQVDTSVLNSYDKSALVKTDVNSVTEVQSKQISDYLTEEKKALFGGKVTYKNFETVDRNDDGKISYMIVSDTDISAVVANINKALAEKGLAALEAVSTVTSAEVKAAIEELSVTEPKDGKKDSVALLGAVELIITDSDATALEVLSALQVKEFNNTKLTTHYIPLYTVGNETDARAFANTSNMSEEEKAELVYTVTDLIGSGKIAGATIEDLDAVAAAVAAITRNLIKGADAFEGLETKDKQVLISYTTV